jgi:alpha-galactosidase
MKRPSFRIILGLALGLIGATLVSAQYAVAQEATRPSLSRPDGKPASLQKKLKVFLLMGQSNLVGMGDLRPEDTPGTLAHLTETEKKFPFLVDQAGNWTTQRTVYYYDAREQHGAWLSATANNGKTIGPELGFGFVMGQVLDEPVLLIKSCIGNRSLGWDLLPPGSKRFVADAKTYAGYHDTPASWIEGQPKQPANWYAGKQYDIELANTKAALADLAKIFPGYRGQGYELASFVWFQGHKDQGSKIYAERYETNLVNLIKSLRHDYAVPDAKFVLATGCGNPGREGLGLKVAEAQLAAADSRLHPEFAGNVRCVDVREFWPRADRSPNPKQDYHYFHNAEVYLNIGLSLGWAMADLLAEKN